MMRKIIELRAGDTIPNGAKLINTRTERGNIIGTSRQIKPGIPFLTPDIETTTTHYQEVPVYVYEVETSEES